MKNKPQQFTRKVSKQSFWKKGTKNMKFDAICGNPPYMTMDNCNGASATPIYQHFVQQAKKLNPNYITMITPSRWLNGGKGLDSFRESMLNDPSIVKFVDFQNAKDCFPTTSISGGVSYFLCDTNHTKFSCAVTNILATTRNTMNRVMNEFDIYVRYNNAVNMIRKIIQIDEEKCNGCGACATACHEGAIQMVDGKARLMRDDFCDGLGDCLPACPTNAIQCGIRKTPDRL